MNTKPDAQALYAEVEAIVAPYLTQTLPIDLTSEQLDALYAFGHGKYVAGMYLEAAYVFCALMRLDLAEARYFKAFAACMLMLNRPQAAMPTYAVAYMLNMDDPEPLYYLALGFSKLKMREAMLDMLLELERETKGRPEWTALRARGRALASQRDSRESAQEQ